MSTNVLIVGSGGREHALAWKLAQSSRIGRLIVAPGNGGTKSIAENAPIKTHEPEKLATFADRNAIDLTVVGPDDPLAIGIVDTFTHRGLKIFGPTEAAARIESSKVFSKILMRDIGIPTPAFEVFNDYSQARGYLQRHPLPVVIKADGLARGKGVYLCFSLADAEEALAEIMVKRQHGDSGNWVVIEEFVEGPEISIHAFCDGTTAVLFPPSQDHKPIGDGDVGPNTGGMGTVAPLPWVTSEQMGWIMTRVVEPILFELAERGTPFTGLLYPGLKLTDQGLVVLEVNARPGDPETQSYMRLLGTDLLDILEDCVEGRFVHRPVGWKQLSAACVTLASAGYPDKCVYGVPISGVDEANKLPGVEVFHAGTVFDGKLRTNGGRVLSVTAVGDYLPQAIELAYEGVSKISFEGMQFRHDIGARAVCYSP